MGEREGERRGKIMRKRERDVIRKDGEREQEYVKMVEEREFERYVMIKLEKKTEK